MTAAPRRDRADPAPAVLLVEPVRSLQLLYQTALATAGHPADRAQTGAEALALVRARAYRVVFLDLALPDMQPLALMSDLRAVAPDLRIVVLTAAGAIGEAVAAMRAGAHDFLVKPVDDMRLVAAVENAATGRRPRAPAAAPRAGPPSSPTLAEEARAGGFIGSSPVMRRVQEKIRSVAASMATVFITGESGTGKELCALAVHESSPRAAGPFIALNCGAIPQDLLESEVFGHVKGSFTGAIADKLGAAAAADGGTLFLDEVCEMLPALQTKLLRFLQTSTVQPVGATRPRKVNVRIVCATNRDPLEAVRRGQFREDLYYRLYVVPIHMPPLRDRGEDVIEIAEAALAHFSADEGRQFDGLTPEVQALFRAQTWPGNVRQLLNVIRNIVVLHEGGRVIPAMLPDALLHAIADNPVGPAPSLPSPQGLPPGLTLAEIERLAVRAAIERHGGSVPRAARELDVSPSTLYRKLDAWARAGV